MQYAVLFTDNESHADMRPKFMADHLAFLQQNSALISAAGPLTDTADSSPAGGLWLVNAGSEAEVKKLVESDPFWPTGLRQSIRILEWKIVFADGEPQ